MVRVLVLLRCGEEGTGSFNGWVADSVHSEHVHATEPLSDKSAHLGMSKLMRMRSGSEASGGPLNFC